MKGAKIALCCVLVAIFALAVCVSSDVRTNAVIGRPVSTPSELTEPAGDSSAHSIFSSQVDSVRPSSTSASSTPPAISTVQPEITEKQAAEELKKQLRRLERSGAAPKAQEEARAWAAQIGGIYPAYARVMEQMLAFCGGDGELTALRGKVQEASAQSGIKADSFRMAAAACYERGQKRVDEITLTFTGDCTFSPINEESHAASFDQVYEKQKSPSYPFDRMFPWFSTDDITCINFEGTLTNSKTHQEKLYYFRGDPSFAKILPSSSVELAGLANNHTMDYFLKGYEDTKKYLTQAGASIFTETEPYIQTVNGIQVVIIGQRTTAKAATDQVLAMIKKYKKADNVVIPVMHWGKEFTNEVQAPMVTAGHRFIDAGADLVIGHHPHLVQGMECYKNKYIVYSLGNFAFGANVGQVTAPYTFAFRARFGVKNGASVMTDASIIPCSPTSNPSGWNNYQPQPLFGAKAKEVAEFLVSISKGLPYGVKKLRYFDF